MRGEEKIVGDLDWDGLHRPRIYYAIATTFCVLSRFEGWVMAIKKTIVDYRFFY